MMEQVEKGLDNYKYLVIRCDEVGAVENGLIEGWLKIDVKASNCIFTDEVMIKLTGE